MTFGISTVGAIMLAGAMATGASVYSADQQRRATNRASDLQAQASRDALTQQQAGADQFKACHFLKERPVEVDAVHFPEVTP